MVTKPTKRYAICISLKHEDWQRLYALQKQGIKVIDVFRRGLTAQEATEAIKKQANNPVVNN